MLDHRGASRFAIDLRGPPLGRRALLEALLVEACLLLILLHMLLRRHFEDLPGYGALLLWALFSCRFAQALWGRRRVTLDGKRLRHRLRRVPTARIRRFLVAQARDPGILPPGPVRYDVVVLREGSPRPLRLRLGLGTEQQAAEVAARLNQALEALRGYSAQSEWKDPGRSTRS